MLVPCDGSACHTGVGKRLGSAQNGIGVYGQTKNHVKQRMSTKKRINELYLQYVLRGRTRPFINQTPYGLTKTDGLQTNHRPFVVVYLATGVKVETDRIRFRYPWGEKASEPTCLNGRVFIRQTLYPLEAIKWRISPGSADDNTDFYFQG